MLAPAGVLPQAAERLDTRRELWPDETRVRVERLNLDAASFRQLERRTHGDGDAVRAAVLDIVRPAGRCRTRSPAPAACSIGVVEEVGPGGLARPRRRRPGRHPGLAVADPARASTTASPGWDGRSEQVPADGYAILFGRCIAARLPDDLDPELALMVMDVCGAPALTARGCVERLRPGPRCVAVVGGAGKSGSLASPRPGRAAPPTVGVVPHQAEADLLDRRRVADEVVVADARDPVALRAAVAGRRRAADVTVVCVDVPGCEGGAVLATREGGTVVFFSMATSFSAAALGAEGLAADVTMLVGNGYVPGHADLALDLLRRHPGVRKLFERRLAEEAPAPLATTGGE